MTAVKGLRNTIMGRAVSASRTRESLSALEPGTPVPHHDSVKRPAHPTFAEIVDAAKAAPRRESRRGRTSDDELRDPAGRTWREVEVRISEERAHGLVLAGAELAWDDCGGRGYAAPIEWISRKDAAELAAGGPPVLRSSRRHGADLSAWRSDDGEWLVLATMHVRWGRLLA